MINRDPSSAVVSQAATFVSEHRVVQMDFGKTRDRAQQHIFNAGLRSGSDRNGVAVAGKTSSHPDNMDVRDWRFFLCYATVRSYVCGHDGFLLFLVGFDKSNGGRASMRDNI